MSFCSEEHPLVRRWIESWHPHESPIRHWRDSAPRRERFLLGILVLPQSLVAVFSNKVGWLETKRIIHKFQAVVVDMLDDELKSGWQGGYKRARLSVVVEDKWVREHSVEPRHAKTMGRRVLLHVGAYGFRRCMQIRAKPRIACGAWTRCGSPTDGPRTLHAMEHSAIKSKKSGGGR